MRYSLEARTLLVPASIVVGKRALHDRDSAFIEQTSNSAEMKEAVCSLVAATKRTGGNGVTPAVRSYRPDIDGLRAIAILSVVLYHAGVPLFTGGFTGVDIFFVISGYLIGGHVFCELRTNTFSYLRFYQRRAKRILPAFIVVLAFTILAGLILLSPFETCQLGKSAVAATLSASNIYFWLKNNYFATKSELDPLLMTWSLGVEEQFYAVLPLFMVLLARFRRNLLLPTILAVCSFSLLFAWYELEKHPMMVFYLLPARAWELGVGLVLAVLELSRRRSSLYPGLSQLVSLGGFLLMLAPMFMLTAESFFPGVAALPSTLGAAMIIAVPASWINRQLLSLAPLVFLGRISYSWYLWHWPILAYLRVVSGRKLPAVDAFVAIAVSFVAAVLSFYLIEQPFRQSARAPLPLLIRYAIVSGAVLAVCAGLWLSHGAPERYPALASVETTENVQHSEPCLADYGIDTPDLSPRCYDAISARPLVALWGDSHSAALAPGVRSVATAQGYGLVQLNKSSCLPLAGATRYMPLHPMHAAECLRFNNKALAVIGTDPQVRIVILAGAWAACLHRNWPDGWLTVDLVSERQPPTIEATKQLFIDALTDLVRSLRADGKQVIVLDDVPSFDFDPVARVRISNIPARQVLAKWLGSPDIADSGFASPGDVSRDLASAVLATSLLQQTLAALPGAALVDLKRALCNGSGQCSYREGSELFYIDNHHLSPDGARHALRNFRLPTTTDPS